MSKKLIVSCQALKNEPLHSSYIMAKMALAAYEGGAKGIRANSVPDIQAIKKKVNLPIIGIIKKTYEDSDVVITPTVKEIEELYQEGVEVIAFDATDRVRPGNQTLMAFIRDIKQRFPDQKWMADVSTVEEASFAESMGVDFIATTLVGYTPKSKRDTPLHVLEKVITDTRLPVVAEGNIDTPEKAKKALELGASAVVVGSAITRPQCITWKFAKKMNEIKKE